MFDLWPSYFEKYFKKELETWVQVGVVVSAALQVALQKKREGNKSFSLELRWWHRVSAASANEQAKVCVSV